MAEKTKPPAKTAEKAAAKTHEGERIAKVLSRAGVSSRREAERMIEIGEVTVNGKVITSPALNVKPTDKITVSGKPLGEPEPARLWLYYKPEGLVTSNSDEKGRETVFDNLPADLPRVMSVGRLDLNSEGLLLLTNDGELKRRLELPSTGWLRKYRVRVNGNPTDPDLEPLRRGITVDGEKFQAMSVVLDRIQGANAWLTVGIREGRNREIRRAMSAIDLTVNRLIRVSYGPFRLGDLVPGQVEEVKQRTLREQLGAKGQTDDEERPARTRATTNVTRTTAAKPGQVKSGPVKTGEAKPQTARPKGTKTTASRNAPAPLKPGEGLKQLSQAWQKATRPAAGAAKPKPSGPTGTATAKPRKPATPSTRSRPPTRPRRGE
jgi:23S rRNA pseudouridine2605 synthase